jgi:hypothetical protein
MWSPQGGGLTPTGQESCDRRLPELATCDWVTRYRSHGGEGRLWLCCETGTVLGDGVAKDNVQDRGLHDCEIGLPLGWVLKIRLFHFVYFGDSTNRRNENEIGLFAATKASSGSGSQPRVIAVRGAGGVDCGGSHCAAAT